MPDESTAYIRGVGSEFNRRQATRVALVSGFVVLIVLLVVFTVSGFDQRSRTDRLKEHGVPVTVTVTGCLAVASGTGETFTGYTCRGMFHLDGHVYNGVILGMSRLHPVGSTVAALSDPGHPTTLSTVRALETTRPTWEGFIAPAIVAALLLACSAVLFWRLRRPRPPAPLPAGPGQLVG